MSDGPFTSGTGGKYIGRYYQKKHAEYFTDELTVKIIALKSSNAAAIDYFFDIIEPHLNEDFVVTAVPSSSATITQDAALTGVRILAERLAEVEGKKRINAVRCLVRHTSVESNHLGGVGADRSMQKHLQSIRVENEHLIRGKSILILDDIRTSGNSIDACKKLLMDAGAAKVVYLALGQTM